MNKVERVKELTRQIDEAESELAELLGETPKKRGRPRKEKGAGGEAAPGGEGETR